MRTVVTGRLLRVGCVLVAAALVLAGCGAEEENPKPKSSGTPSPSPSVAIPDGVTLTRAGTNLPFGSEATVAYEANPKRSTVLRLRVDKVTQGAISDLASFDMDAQVLASTLYYVNVSVTNVGEGEFGGIAIPIWAVDQTDTLIQPSGFTTAFPRCPSGPLPRSFGPKATISTCLLYLVPNHGTLRKLSFRPDQALEPVTWTGAITKPAPKKAKKGKKKNSGKKAAN